MANQNGGVGTIEPALAIILAAGKSTRMKSLLPKVVHEICGRPMVEYVIDAARDAGVRRIVLVVGHGAETVRGLARHLHASVGQTLFNGSSCCLAPGTLLSNAFLYQIAAAVQSRLMLPCP